MKFALIRKKLTGAFLAAVTLFSVTAYLADDNNNNNTTTVSATSYSCSISNGQRLNSGDYIQNGYYKACMQHDGNFVVYKFGYGYNGMSSTYWETPVWATMTCSPNTYSSCWATMQNDGNFVVYATRKSSSERVVLYNAATDNSMHANQYVSYSLALSSSGSLQVKRYTPSGTTVLRDITSASGGALTWPVPSSKSLKSSYTETSGRKKQHNALDIGTDGKAGNPAIVSALAGTVKYVCNNGVGGGYGNYVVIEHVYYFNGVAGLCVTKYNHLSSTCVTTGQYVANGQVIGYMGTTGNSTGVHLDFQFYKQPFYRMNGNNVATSSGAVATPTDPLSYMKWPKGLKNTCTAINRKTSCNACVTYFNRIKARFVIF